MPHLKMQTANAFPCLLGRALHSPSQNPHPSSLQVLSPPTMSMKNLIRRVGGKDLCPSCQPDDLSPPSEFTPMLVRLHVSQVRDGVSLQSVLPRLSARRGTSHQSWDAGNWEGTPARSSLFLSGGKCFFPMQNFVLKNNQPPLRVFPLEYTVYLKAHFCACFVLSPEPPHLQLFLHFFFNVFDTVILAV